VSPAYRNFDQIVLGGCDHILEASRIFQELAEKGYGHFSQLRPKFYESVERIEGRKLRPGTINIRVHGPMPIPSKQAIRIEGLDDIDRSDNDNQDILITPCTCNHYRGYWILPVFKGTQTPNPLGHYPHRIIEVSLEDELPNIKPGVELDVMLLDSTNDFSEI
jgi:hypothetical protein